MFKSATIKLTLFYVLAISTVCIIFSISVYGLASSRIDNEARRQVDIFQRFNAGEGSPASRPPSGQQPPAVNDEVRQEIRQQIQNDRNELLRNILIVNVFIVIFGGIASYFFAKATLKPIGSTMEKQRRFTADASHELRTPLTVMKAEIDLALEQDLSADELREVLVSNLEEVQRLSDLSEQLLALTSVEDSSICVEKLDLSSLVNEFVDSFEQKHDLNVDKNIEPQIHVLGEPSLLKNYMQILFDNAVKYSGEDQPVISVSLMKNSSYCVLVVRDEGIGIDLSDSDKIFDRFYRSNEAKKVGKQGYGLGLSLASQIAKKHGSKIHLDSKLGEYSKFSIQLKIA